MTESSVVEQVCDRALRLRLRRSSGRGSQGLWRYVASKTMRTLELINLGEKLCA
jgi:hypothetical protein